MSKFSQSGLHPQVLPLLLIFLLFVRIESLPGVQAEDPVAQIFMGRSAYCPQYGVQHDHDDQDDHDDEDNLG